MMSLLRDHEPQRFVDALAADVASADLCWGAPGNARLFAGTLRQLRPFLAAVAAARAAAAGFVGAAREDVPFEYASAPLKRITYPQLDDEIIVGGTFVRFLVRDGDARR